MISEGYAVTDGCHQAVTWTLASDGEAQIHAFAGDRSGQASRRRCASRRRSLTSPLVAARAVSPTRRRLPASRKLLGPCVIEALGNAFMAAKLANAGLAPKAVQNDTDLLFGRMTLAGCPPDVLHDPLGRGFTGHGFLSHLHSLMVTMSQKSSLPQAAKSVSQALTPDRLAVGIGYLRLESSHLSAKVRQNRAEEIG